MLATKCYGFKGKGEGGDGNDEAGGKGMKNQYKMSAEVKGGERAVKDCLDTHYESRCYVVGTLNGL